MRFTVDSDISDDLFSVIKQKVKFMGDVVFAYGLVNKKNLSEISIVSNYHHAWVKTYVDNKFQYIDPVITMALGRSSPFSWDERHAFLPKTNSGKVFSLSKEYNIVNGYTFVLHDHADSLAVLSLVISGDAKNNVEDEIKKNKAELQLSLIEIHERMSVLNREKNSSNYLKSALLTLREHEILYWSSMGKVYEEIAMILGISLRTVKFHMANVTRKLNVTNVRQAIRLSTELGLLKNNASIVK